MKIGGWRTKNIHWNQGEEVKVRQFIERMTRLGWDEGDTDWTGDTEWAKKADGEWDWCTQMIKDEPLFSKGVKRD